MSKKALITGITGQDGSYLAELLLTKGYDVYGIIRRASSFNTKRIDHIFKDFHEKGVKLHLVYGDLNDASSLNRIIRDIRPDEVYNIGAQSHVGVSFSIPEYTGEITGLGTIRLLEAIRESKMENKVKFYQASSSEMFGKVLEVPQKETTPFYPRSPYGCAKAYSFWIAKNYREAYNMFICNGILFNHESPRRGETFVTKKITHAVARIKLGLQDKLYLGNLEAKRDWGFAGDFVEAMWLMLQQKRPDDYVVATGKSYSVRQFLEETFKIAGIKIKSNGKKGLKEKYVDIETGKAVVEMDPKYLRPTEVDYLIGDASKARKALGWKPKVSFKELVKMMYEADYKEEYLKLHGTRHKTI
jgi:GDPmannose 4,6-dehydratase